MTGRKRNEIVIIRVNADRLSRPSHYAIRCNFFRRAVRAGDRYRYYYLVPKTKGIRNARRRRGWPRQRPAI